MPALMNGVIHFESGHDSIKAAAKGVIGIRRAVFMLADICLIDFLRVLKVLRVLDFCDADKRLGYAGQFFLHQ